ncbi:hypothetical protein F7725_013275 [Dissostichus mawsoni]|uniref:Uncharacterized protein n=1 Tax=Dissostichus mawsoni TaxID=36200 RepID=A0A7J5YQV8_DISMA|nr:hypothetical protein F7725_013275 [Dissostichus mawsoni]
MENCTTSAGVKEIKLSTLPKWSLLLKKQTNCLRSFTAAILVDTVEWRRLTVPLLLGTIGLAWKMTYASGFLIVHSARPREPTLKKSWSTVR